MTTPSIKQLGRVEIAEFVVQRLNATLASTQRAYADSSPKIGHFVVDDVLPVPLATRIFDAFPKPTGMRMKKTLREYKYVAAQMNNYDPILEETIYAFQDPRVVELITRITSIGRLYPDEHLYAGGISLMGHKNYLNPHLDNSHDKDRERWRVLNLLYYVTPDWALANGGNLELWPQGVTGEPVTIHSKFNRLAVMATHDRSWHSVSPISLEGVTRRCVSNYYFADEALKAGESFHVTSFRGRPEQGVTDVLLRTDAALRGAVRKVFKRGVTKTTHMYKKP